MQYSQDLDMHSINLHNKYSRLFNGHIKLWHSWVNINYSKYLEGGNYCGIIFYLITTLQLLHL